MPVLLLIDYMRALVAACIPRAPAKPAAAPVPTSAHAPSLKVAAPVRAAPAVPGKRRSAKPRRPRGLIRIDANQSILSQVRN